MGIGDKPAGRISQYIYVPKPKLKYPTKLND